MVSPAYKVKIDKIVLDSVVEEETIVEEVNVPLLKATDMIVAILAVYFLKDLTFPSCFGQLLGFLQECALNDPFLFKSKKCTELITEFNSYLQ